MITIELTSVHMGAGGWILTKKVNGVVVLEERYSAYANAYDRARYFNRMNWRVKIFKNGRIVRP